MKIDSTVAGFRNRLNSRFGEVEASLENIRSCAVGVCVWSIRFMAVAGLVYGLTIGGFGIHGDSLSKLALYIVISGLVAFGANHLAAQVDLRPSGMPMLAVATMLSFNPIAVPLWAVEPSMVPFFYLILIVLASFLSDWRTVLATSGACAAMIALLWSHDPSSLAGHGDAVLAACVVCGAIAALLVVKNSIHATVVATTEERAEKAYTDVSRVRIAMANQRRETYTYEEFQRKLAEVLGYVEHSMSSGAADVGAGLELAKKELIALANDSGEMKRYADRIAESSAEVPNFLRHDRVVRTLAENIESALAEMTRFGVLARGISSDTTVLLSNLDEIRGQRDTILTKATALNPKLDPDGSVRQALEEAAADLSNATAMVDQILGRVRSNAEGIVSDADALTRHVGASITTLHGLSDGLRTAYDRLQNIGLDTQGLMTKAVRVEPILRVTAAGISKTGQKISHMVSQIASMLRRSPEIETQRRHPRAHYDGHVRILQDGRTYESRAINVSQSGMLMTVTPANSRLVPGGVELTVDGLGSCQGTLLSVSDVGLHITFDALDRDIQTAIAELVTRTTREFEDSAAEAAASAQADLRPHSKRPGRPQPALRVDPPLPGAVAPPAPPAYAAAPPNPPPADSPRPLFAPAPAADELAEGIDPSILLLRSSEDPTADATELAPSPTPSPGDGPTPAAPAPRIRHRADAAGVAPSATAKRPKRGASPSFSTPSLPPSANDPTFTARPAEGAAHPTPPGAAAPGGGKASKRRITP